MTKNIYVVYLIFVLHIVIPVVVYAEKCCMHGPFVGGNTSRCTTVANKDECDKKPKGVLVGKEIPNSLIPKGNGVGECQKDGVTCCSASVSESSLTNTDSFPICDKLLVELSGFVAIPTDKGVSLSWNTKTEVDSQGFRIWRAIPDLNSYCGCSGDIHNYTQIQVLDKEGKPILILAKGDKVSGSEYSYLDESAKPGIAYCYALEDIDSKGKSTYYFEYVAFTPDGISKEKK